MRVERTQLENVFGHIIITSIPDRLLYNTDYLSMYRYFPSNYLRGEYCSGRIQAFKGGTEKERFTVQLSCKINGGKLPI